VPQVSDDSSKKKPPAAKPQPAAPVAKPKPTNPAPAARPVVDSDGVIESISVNEKELTQEQLESIPTADPVRFQGIVTLILLGVLVVLGGLSVYLGIQMFGSDGDGAYLDGAPDPNAGLMVLPENPFIPGQGPSIAQTVPLTPPVMYVVDAGRSMGGLYPFAKDIVRASALSLGGGSSFGVVIAQDPNNIFIGETMHPGGSAGEQAIREPILSMIDDGPIEPGGAPNLTRAIDQALAKKPGTLVLIVGEKIFDKPRGIALAIEAANARLILLCLGSQGEDQTESQDRLIRVLGDKARRIEYSTGQLQKDYQKRKLPR